MPDERVLQVQRWVNATYRGVPRYVEVREDGVTGTKTVQALTMALQHELGIGDLFPGFGELTLGSLQARYPVINGRTPPGNVIRIVQSALYCKGYSGGDLGGRYDSATSGSVRRLKGHMGLSGSGVTPKVFKALLTMDSYRKAKNGSNVVRSVQRWLNGRYADRAKYFLIPCDGLPSLASYRVLLPAVQYELGMSDEERIGVLGPKTKAGLSAAPLVQGSTGPMVRLLRGALLLNRRTGVAFTDSFDAALAARVRAFQSSMRLPVNGLGDYTTWASLLTSYGDIERPGTACDCVTEINAARGKTLWDAGYRYVGRYLTNAVGATYDKTIRPGELAVIAAAGLSVFPIYQAVGTSRDHFQAATGETDALAAVNAARSYGFKSGTRIFFAVDYNAPASDLATNILPYFQAVKAVFDHHGAGYLVGIYGPRYICSGVAAAGLSGASFVADRSTGYEGNAGFPLPDDWAYDQIATIKVGAGPGAIEIDKCVASGRDTGQNSFDPPGP